MTTPDTRIGWIGTGRMGHAMVRRLLQSGQDVHVWNRTRAKADDLTALGASVVDSVGDLADRDVVFTMVSADADLMDVLLGDGGLLTQHVAPAYLVDSSTVSAETSQRVRAAAAERGTAFLVAPVSGNAKVVKAGRLSIAVSGPAEAYAAVEPLLQLIGDTTRVGDADLARLVKIAHNVFLGVVTQSLAEVTVLAESGGISRAAFLEFMNDSVLGSVFTRYKGTGIRQPRSHPDVHHGVAGQRPRPRPGCRTAAGRTDAARRSYPGDSALGRRTRTWRRGLRRVAPRGSAQRGHRTPTRGGRGGRRPRGAESSHRGPATHRSLTRRKPTINHPGRSLR